MNAARNVPAVKPGLKGCLCGEPLIRASYYGDRGILERRTGIVQAPLVVQCLNGHTRELWMTPEEARAYFESVMVVA